MRHALERRELARAVLDGIDGQLVGSMVRDQSIHESLKQRALSCLRTTIHGKVAALEEVEYVGILALVQRVVVHTERSGEVCRLATERGPRGTVERSLRVHRKRGRGQLRQGNQGR